MLQFDNLVARYGEAAVQSMIENLERFEGISGSPDLSLEKRWQNLMQKSDPSKRVA